MVDDEDRDTLESERELPKEDETLDESKFIQEQYKSDPTTIWVWLFFLAAFLLLAWGVGSQLSGYLQQGSEAKPFLQVTNRDFSLFLWQNPEFMRINSKNKSAYLPGFEYLDKVNMVPKTADQYVVAPPEVLFRYHTWSRLLKGEYVARPIPTDEFVEFLEYEEAWQPEYWPKAPGAYKELVQGLKPTSHDDLQAQPLSVLPLDVRMAFQGWKNFRFEGQQINDVKPTYKAMVAFLRAHPHYQRSYWRNIVDTDRLHYLVGLTNGKANSDEVIPADQLTPFLKVGFFNAQSAMKEAASGKQGK